MYDVSSEEPSLLENVMPEGAMPEELEGVTEGAGDAVEGATESIGDAVEGLFGN